MQESTPEWALKMSRTVELQLSPRYSRTSLLGAGGMAAVFLAHDDQLQRRVAVKVLPPHMASDPALRKRFLHEARIAAALDHPSIAPIFEVVDDAELPFFVMKLIEGSSLEALVGSFAERDPGEVARVVSDIAIALDHAHARGFIHRDVKPSNVIVEGSGRAVLTDFGIAKAVTAATQLTDAGMVVGTPHFMSPEQAQGLALTGASDQYSLGALAFCLMTGAVPFDGDSQFSILYKQIHSMPPRPSSLRGSLPPALDSVILRALAKRPIERWSTCAAFAEALTHAATGTEPTPYGVGAGPTTPLPEMIDRNAPSRLQNWWRRRVPQSLGVGALLGLLALGWSLRKGATAADGSPVSMLRIRLVEYVLPTDGTVRVVPLAIGPTGDTLPTPGAEDLVYSVADTTIVEVSRTGLIIGLRTGRTILTIKYGHLSAGAIVRVQEASLLEVVVSPDSLSMTVGQTRSVFPAAFDATGNVIPTARFSYSSDDPDVAEVSPDGKVAGRRPGFAKIVVIAVFGGASAKQVTIPVVVDSTNGQ